MSTAPEIKSPERKLRVIAEPVLYTQPEVSAVVTTWASFARSITLM